MINQYGFGLMRYELTKKVDLEVKIEPSTNIEEITLDLGLTSLHDVVAPSQTCASSNGRSSSEGNRKERGELHRVLGLRKEGFTR